MRWEMMGMNLMVHLLRAHQTGWTTQPSSAVKCLRPSHVCCCCGCLQVRITSVNKVRNYISYAVALLDEKGHSSVVLKAMGQAINKAVVVGE